MSPLASSRGSSSTSHSPAPSSSYAFITQPAPNQYSLNSNVSYHGIASHPGTTTSLYSQASGYSQAPLQTSLEVRPRITTFYRAPNTGMPPPSRNSTITSPVSPSLGQGFRTDYNTTGLSPQQQQQLPRQHYSSQPTTLYQLSPSPQSPLSAMSRSLDSSSGPGSQSVPPFDPTKHFHSLSDGRGANVTVEIQAKIDKGFFRADSDWTCYRRNYFSVACAYGLKSDVELDADQVYLHRNQPERVHAFAVCIAAKVDGESGTPIELVQHTPKRDKGPMSAPEKRELKPNPSGNLSVFTGSGAFNPSIHPNPTQHHHASEIEHMYPGNTENQNVANFERIQFKKATANNGKRRAAQQYFHIVVELFAKLRKSNKSEEYEWVKVAHRLSAQMVVRGRSPGHYSDERRGSSASMGGGGASGGDLGGYYRDGSGPGQPGHILSSFGGARYPGAGYTTHHSSLTHSPPSDCHSLPSSASSITSGPFLDGLQQPSSLTIEDSAMTDMYENHFDNPIHGISTRPGGLRSAASTSPPLADTGFTYAPSTSTMKEESQYLKPESGRQARLIGTLSPMFGGDWTTSESQMPPRECRPLSMDKSRSFFPQMSAL